MSEPEALPSRAVMRRLERWLYPRLGSSRPTVGEAAAALKMSAGEVLHLVDHHYWIEAEGDRSDPASMRLDADGE